MNEKHRLRCALYVGPLNLAASGNTALLFAKQAFAYRTEEPSGDLWQADEEDYYAQDFCYGAAGTGHFYTTDKNKKNTPEKMEMKKYDPVVRKHVIYKEGKIK